MNIPEGFDPKTKLYTQDEAWKMVTIAVTRILYDVIRFYEDKEENYISIDWLRGYTDKLAQEFPKFDKDKSE